MGSFLGNQTYNNSLPKAFINWIAFDERFNYVAAGSGFEQVGASDVYTTHIRTNLPVSKSGYLYIYVSNETPNIDVFFDNLQVTHTRGALLEENSYYPFGLTMAGLGSKALAFGGNENKQRFNGYEQQNSEFSDGSGLEWYDYKNRFYDNQIGRFFVQDRLATDYLYYTPYQFAGNEVPNAIDLDGLEPLRISPNEGILPPSDNLIRRKTLGEYMPYSGPSPKKTSMTGGKYMTGGQGGGEYAKGRKGDLDDGDGDTIEAGLLIAAFAVGKSSLDAKSAGNTLDVFKEQFLMMADARDGADAKIAADERKESQEENNRTTGTKDANSEKSNTQKPKIKKGDVFYTTELGFNRVKLSDSTARLAAPSDGPAKDTVKPGQRF